MTTRLVAFICDGIDSLKERDNYNKVKEIAEEGGFHLRVWDGKAYINHHIIDRDCVNDKSNTLLDELKDKGVNTDRGLIEFEATYEEHPFGLEIWNGYLLAYTLRDLGLFRISFDQPPKMVSLYSDSYEKIEINYIAFEF